MQTKLQWKAAEKAHLKGQRVTYTVRRALADEYLDKVMQSPGWMLPFILESFQWHCARGLIARGYRDYEVGFGETFSQSMRGGPLGGGEPGIFFFRVTAEVSEHQLELRREWREIWPYKWHRRVFPFRRLDPQSWRWRDWLRPSRWEKVPTITWENQQ